MAHNDAKDLALSIDPAVLKPLFKTRAYRHALAMLFDWSVIALTIYLCVRYFNPLTYFLAVLIIGARMHALAILMHDATHYRFLKNRRWNDWLTNLLIMYPIFSTLEQYRQNHLRHHRHLNTENDPDWVNKLGKRDFTFPKTRAEFLRTVLSYLLLYKGVSDAVWFLRRFSSVEAKAHTQAVPQWPRLLFYVVLATVLTLTGTWRYFLLFWIVPYLSTFFMCQYVRSVAEHFGELAYDNLLTSTRSVRATPLERFFLAPHHVGYHLEHHLYPGVPFYHLPALHRALMITEDYRGQAHITQGYVRGLLRELGDVRLAV
jgi:fatty acid desaturase